MYRVEHVTHGNGPYCLPIGLPRPVPIVADEYKLHPDIRFYNLREIVAANCIFGFKSLCDLKSWFNSTERYLLHRHDYVVRQYELLPGAIRYWDDSQIAIDRRKIKAVLANPISSMEI